MKIISMAPLGEDDLYQKYEVTELIDQLSSFMLLINASSNFPVLSVLNDLFSKGKLDEGMSGGVQWIIFVLTEEERIEIKKEIADQYQIDFISNEVLDSMSSYADWFKKAMTQIK